MARQTPTLTAEPHTQQSLPSAKRGFPPSPKSPQTRALDPRAGLSFSASPQPEFTQVITTVRSSPSMRCYAEILRTDFAITVDLALVAAVDGIGKLISLAQPVGTPDKRR
jgi:hypothetical protein